MLKSPWVDTVEELDEEIVLKLPGKDLLLSSKICCKQKIEI